MESHIVLGSLYGDEGKGRTVDYLCSKSKNPIVVRFSGGQQAGHTVIRDGVKHTHSNFGAGTLQGVETYFTEDTTFYPPTIMREHRKLVAKGVRNVKLVLHPLSKMTTPYDVFANRTCGDNLSHGTCGLGIGKTMKRNEGPIKVFAIDMAREDLLNEKIDQVKDFYSHVYYSSEENDEWKDWELALEYIKKFTTVKGYEYLRNFDTLVFEGSQGILLDMDHGVFPNVTFSNTTSKNAHKVLDYLRIHTRHIYYITRSYLTRHGSGYFVEEPINLINTEEEINVNNKYQREFKVANMDYDLLNYAIDIDSIYSSDVFKISSKNLVVTCLDQLENFEFDYSKLKRNFNNIYECDSPRAESIKLKE